MKPALVPLTTNPFERTARRGPRSANFSFRDVRHGPRIVEADTDHILSDVVGQREIKDLQVVVAAPVLT